MFDSHWLKLRGVQVGSTANSTVSPVSGSTSFHGTEPDPETLRSYRSLVQRVASSPYFEKSTRLREFLLYVCERALTSPRADIHEQEIGASVFGRPSSYDTSQDNIVRVNASQLRKKLEAYFASEGVDEPVVFEIPRGKYLPVFKQKTKGVSDIHAVSAASSSTEIRKGRFRTFITAALAALSVVLLGLCVWLSTQLRAAKSDFKLSPSVAALWEQLFNKERPVDLVVADSSLSLFQDFTQRPITLSEYLKRDSWPTADSLSQKKALQSAARTAAERSYTSLADATITNRFSVLASKEQSQLSVFFARDFNIRHLESDNAILLGSKRANPWVELFENRLNFRFGYDQAARESYFENKSPRAGETSEYRNNPVQSYCVIDFLPNLNRAGNVLIIAGTEMEGTEVGAEFLTNEKSMSGLRRLLGADSREHLPYFELLLRSKKIGGAATEIDIVSYRLLQL